MVYSIAGQTQLPWQSEGLLEGELSQFSGDHDGFTGQKAVRIEMIRDFLSGQRKSNWPLTYRVRYEEYGRDYRL
jgi:hypothetical protein